MAPSRSALIAAHQSQTMQVRERLTDYAKTLWGGLGSWRDEDVQRFVDLMTPRVLAGRASAAVQAAFCAADPAVVLHGRSSAE